MRNFLRAGVIAGMATALLASVPARAQDDGMMRHEMHRHMMHRMMRHEMHGDMRHRMMRHEMHREMRHHRMHDTM